MRSRPASVETTTALLAEPPPWWVAALALAGALVVQSSLAPLLAFHDGVVNVVVLVTFWFAIRCGPSGALAFGTFAGAGEDALGSTGAAATLATGALAWLVSRTRLKVQLDNPALLFVTIAGATLGRAMFALFVLVFEGRPLAGLATHLHAVLWQSLMTGLAGALTIAIFPRLGVDRGRY